MGREGRERRRGGEAAFPRPRGRLLELPEAVKDQPKRLSQFCFRVILSWEGHVSAFPHVEKCSVMKIHGGQWAGRPPWQRNPRDLSLSEALQTRGPHTPDTEATQENGRHLNKSESRVKPWTKYFGSDETILDFDVLCLLFGFPLEQRCVRRPWLASWQGSLQEWFLSFFLFLKKTFWIST